MTGSAGDMQYNNQWRPVIPNPMSDGQYNPGVSKGL